MNYHFRITLILSLAAVFFSSCLTGSRIGYHQQEASYNRTKIQGGSVLLLYSVPITDKEREAQVFKWLEKLDDKITHRHTAKKKGIEIPAYIAPENMEAELSKINDNSSFQFLMIVDGYPMPTETNGGNLVSAIIEVWDIKRQAIVYNSHSTIKSKTRRIKNDRGAFGGIVFNQTYGKPIAIEELLYFGIKREIQRLKVLY